MIVEIVRESDDCAKVMIVDIKLDENHEEKVLYGPSSNQ